MLEKRESYRGIFVMRDQIISILPRNVILKKYSSWSVTHIFRVTWKKLQSKIEISVIRDASIFQFVNRDRDPPCTTLKNCFNFDFFVIYDLLWIFMCKQWTDDFCAYNFEDFSVIKANLVPRLFLRERKDPGRSWSRATQILGGKLKQHLGRGGRVLRLENYNLCA